MDTPDDPVSRGLRALPDALRSLAARGVPRRYRKGMLLIQEGDHRDEQYIVLHGRVQAYSIDDRGRRIVFGEYGPGEYLGEMSLDGGARSASVEALESTWCAMLTRHTLREHIAANPEFAFELIARVIRRARAATRTARELALLDVRERVVALLDHLAVTREDGTRVIEERLTHQDIADRVGCERSMVSRILKDMHDRGGLETRAGGGVILRTHPLPRW